MRRILRARPVAAGLVLLAAAVTAAGCSSSSSTSTGSGSSSAPSTSASPSTSSSGSGSTSESPSGLPLGAPLTVAQQAAILAKYTGGKVGKATGAPIELGWVNTDTGLSAFPVFTEAAKAAVAFVNNNLDGVNGHPIKFVTCSIASEEDGTSCGSTFVNDPNLHAVIESVLIAGSDTFFKTINNTKAVVQVSANSPADLDPYPGQTPNVFTLNAGSVGGYAAQVTYAVKYEHIKKMLLIGEDDPAVREGYASLAKELAGFGIQTKSVFTTPGAGASQIAADLQGVQATSYDGWFNSSDQQTCANVYAYAQQAGMPKLLIGSECNGSLFKSQYGSWSPKGLVFPDLGWNVFLPNETPQQDAINYAISEGVPTGNDPYSEGDSFYSVLNTVRAMNAAGTKQTTAGIATAIRGLKAPILGNAGSGFDCGAVANYPTICGDVSGLVEYNGTSYVRISPSKTVPDLQVWQFKS